MAASNFQNCLTFTLHYEGGFTNNPRDPGGPTNLGVTIATLSHELGRAATIAEVRALTPATATPIYRKKFWNLIDGDGLPAGVDLITFDIAVNNGPGRALRWLDETANTAPRDRILALHKFRVGFWRSLPIFATFAGRWMKRETACLAAALKYVS